MSQFFLKDECFIAAEIGINHNGDMELAKEMILVAKNAGANGIKFQNYKTEDFISNKNIEYEYLSQGFLIKEKQFEMFKRYELSFSQLKELKEYSDSIGILFFSTPTGSQGIQDLLDLNVSLLKNGSDFLQNLPFIKLIAESGLPSILSTGMASLADIDEAVRTYENAGGKELILLHCVSQYPAPLEDVHLNKITSLKHAFGYPVGFSDHTEGVEASIGAVALGACFIEKHFTLSHDLPGPDHRFSSTPDEFSALVNSIRSIELALGNSKLTPTKTEKVNAESFQLSCVAKNNLAKGSAVDINDISFSRPGDGIPPKFMNFISGKTLKLDKLAGEVFNLSDLK